MSRPSTLAAALAVAIPLAGTACGERDPPEGGIGELRLQLGGSGLADEWRALRAVAFDLAQQGCVGARVVDPGATPLATSGLVHPGTLRVTLSIPAGARTIYVEVYRDGEGLDLLGTGCAEAVLSPGQQTTVRVEIVLSVGDADADADVTDVVPDADADADADDVLDGDDDGASEGDGADEAPAEDVADVADAPPVPGLSLNEVDYDQTGRDTMEFVELYNASDEPVPCAGLELRFVNGVGAALYSTQPLTCSWIDTGSFHVVGSSLLRASITCPSSQVLGAGGEDLIQNGPSTAGGPGDAVALVDTSSGTPVVLDQLVYEGTVAGWGEGAFAGVDDSSGFSLQRDPAGHDTGDNASDFALLPPTPCAMP